jgi:hypothetical protein
MDYLPTEIIDEIIIRTDFQTAITLHNEYAIKKLYNPKIHHWEWAAKYGHLEVIKWLHVNRTEGCTYWAMNYAAEHGHLEVVKWLRVNRTESCTYWAMHGAAENGHLEVIKWLYENRTEDYTDYEMDNGQGSRVWSSLSIID